MKETQITPARNESGLVVDPELLAQDPEAFKKTLIAQVRARVGTRVVDTKTVFQDIIKQTLEAFLEVEMEEQLGYAKYAPKGRGSGNSRNGSTSKRVRGESAKSRSKRRATATASLSPRWCPSARVPSATSAT